MTIPEQAVEQIKWRRVDGEPFEYAIQQGPHGDEFVKLIDGSCLRRPFMGVERSALPPLRAREEIARIIRWASKEALYNGAGKVINPEIFDEAAHRILSDTAGQESRDGSPRNAFLVNEIIEKASLMTTGKVGYLGHIIKCAETLKERLPAPPVTEPIVAEKQT